VHVASAFARSGERSDHFGSYVQIELTTRKSAEMTSVAARREMHFDIEL
jgi:hypothetical protein